MVTYHDTRMEVLIGDHIEFKIGLFFWRGWQSGRVHYVPGISQKTDELEHNGLTWVAIHDVRGCQSGHIVLPDTKSLRKNVRFISRAADGFTRTPADYCFGDEAPTDALNETPNQAMERTATRCAYTFSVARTLSPRLICVLGGRRSSCSR